MLSQFSCLNGYAVLQLLSHARQESLSLAALLQRIYLDPGYTIQVAGMPQHIATGLAASLARKCSRQSLESRELTFKKKRSIAQQGVATSEMLPETHMHTTTCGAPRDPRVCAAHQEAVHVSESDDVSVLNSPAFSSGNSGLLLSDTGPTRACDSQAGSKLGLKHARELSDASHKPVVNTRELVKQSQANAMPAILQPKLHGVGKIRLTHESAMQSGQRAVTHKTTGVPCGKWQNC
jgi:hypothetical protein